MDWIPESLSSVNRGDVVAILEHSSANHVSSPVIDCDQVATLLTINLYEGFAR